MMTLRHIYCYPIKGLSPLAMDNIELQAGTRLPFDRKYALARPGTANSSATTWRPKAHFLMLMSDEVLATVQCAFGPAPGRLALRRGDEVLLTEDLNDAEGKRRIEEFFFDLMGGKLKERPPLVDAGDGHFMDKPDEVISLIGLPSVADLGLRLDRDIDPLRFRANLYFDGALPWAELGWIGARIRIGDAELSVDRANSRCAAVNVDPATALRDANIPRDLYRMFGHSDLGVYVHVTVGGRIAIGDQLHLIRETADAL